MGTAKRERQKANRAQRQVELARVERTTSIRRTVTRFGIIAALAIIGVVVIAWLGGAFDGGDDDAPAVDDAVEQPEVELPAQLPTDLVVTTLVEGSGDAAEVGDTVEVYYVGVVSDDGTEFDANYGNPTGFTVTLGEGRVIRGWDEGLVGVQAGGRYQLDIPSDLAYGDTPQPGSAIEPGDALTFVVDVVSVTGAGS